LTLCYVKCPYTPPHKFAIDFPRLMMRAKLVKVRREGVRMRERMLGDPDRLALLSAGAFAGLTNWANSRPLLRTALERLIGIHRKRRLPTFARTTFARWFRRRKARSTTGDKVALFATCSVDYNYPQDRGSSRRLRDPAGVIRR
jgi:glycerol-3-phosphate dehydrogenase subunit C